MKKYSAAVLARRLANLPETNLSRRSAGGRAEGEIERAIEANQVVLCAARPAPAKQPSCRRFVSNSSAEWQE